jgi:hypothetical protein
MAIAFAGEHYSTSERITILLAGMLAFWFGIRGISTGEVPLQFATLRRSEGAPPFWFGIAINLVIGIVCLLGSIFGFDFLK